MPLGVRGVVHLHQEPVTVGLEPIRVDIALDLGICRVRVVNSMGPKELCLGLVEPTRHKYGDVVQPVVSWRGGEHHPTVLTGYLVERLDPGSRTHEALLIKYEHGPSDLGVLLDVVPGIDRDRLTQPASGLPRHQAEQCQLLFPLKAVALLRGGDDVERFWSRRLGVLAVSVDLEACFDDLVHKICQGDPGLTGSNAAPEYCPIA